MQLPSTKALEILATELADDMFWLLIFTVLHLSVEPRPHGVHLMTNEVLPVRAINITLLAVVVL
jgi:hypothetical protein